MERRILNTDELSDALKSLSGWTINGKMLKKRMKFENFALALHFVNRVGIIAEATNHHPDICLGWGYAELSLTTHDRDGITDVDIALARRVDAL